VPLRILASFHTLFYAPLHVAQRLGAFKFFLARGARFFPGRFPGAP
jgi:hypothetical protein